MRAILAHRRREPKDFRERWRRPGARNLRRAGLTNNCLFAKESPMKKVFAALVASVFALSSASVLACAGDKAKDEKQMSTPSKPKI
jgi:hypothetical protein